MSAQPQTPVHLDPLGALADAVRELVEPAHHVERYQPYDDATRRHMPMRLHPTRHPSLLEQLRAAGSAGRSGDAETTSGFESRPASRLAALDRLMTIEQAVDDWLVRRLDVEVRATLEGNLRLLVGIASDLEDQQLVDLAREARRWATWAKVVTGWESEPWKPNATCPMCERRGGLRVRLEEHAAACLDCGETWDSTTIALLADYLRLENVGRNSQHEHAARLAADLTSWFPHRGPCLMCGIPGEDARHRVIDAIVSRIRAGDDHHLVARDYGLDVQAVHAATAWADQNPDAQ